MKAASYISFLLSLHITNIFSFTFHTKTNAFTPLKTKQSTLLSSTNKNNEIVIIGGGFGGLYTALTLSTLFQTLPNSLSKPNIKLIDPKERFIFLPLLYELCIDNISLDEVAPTYQDLIRGSDIEFIQGDVLDVDPEENAVVVRNSNDLSAIQGDACVKYDTLVIATGNAPPTVDKLESKLKGASECISSLCTFYTIDDCYDLRRRLTYLKQQNTKNVVIVGAGYSGVELACNIVSDDKDMNVTLIHKGSQILSDATTYNRDNAMQQLNDLGVNLLTDTFVDQVTNCTNESAYPPCMIYTKSKDTQDSIKADVVIWTAGGGGEGSNNIVSSLSSYNITKNQKIIVGSCLNVDTMNNIYAIGDISQTDKILPQTAQKAIQQAYTTSWNIFSQYVNTNIITKLNDKQRLPIPIPELPRVEFENIELGEILTLGTKEGTVSTLGGLIQVNGAAGGVARRLIYSVRMPTWMQALLSTVRNLNRFLLFGLLDKE